MPSKISIECFVSFFVGVLITVLLFLFLGGIFLSIPTLWDFSAFELLKFFVTVFIAIFIAYYLRNRYSDRQAQKQLFINILNDISEEYDNPKGLLDYMRKTGKTQDERNEISLFLKKMTNKIYILKEQKKVFARRVDEFVLKLDNEHLRIKELLMDDPNYNSGSDAFSDSKIGEVTMSITSIILWSDQAKLRLFD